MKILQTTILGLLAASFASADEANIAAFAATPTVAPTPMEPAAMQNWYAEATAVAGVSGNDILQNLAIPAVMPDKVNIIGGDLTLGYALDDQNAFQLRFGYGFGHDLRRVEGISGSNVYIDKNTMKVHSFTLMPGYRFTKELNDSWSLFAAVHVGISNQSLKFEAEAIEDSNRYHHERDHNSDWGFAYSVELGARYDITSGVYTFLAYEFRGSTTESTISSAWHSNALESKAQTYHVFRLGMGFSF